ncbi:MAG: hypothetical protein JNJ64_09380 [Flavobacteriales bacterium]|nr:hypothetical protein [Flavobacteriales bacterium]
MRAALLPLLLVTTPLVAQETYWRPDTTQDPLRWSVGVELLRPVIDLIASSGDDHYLRVEAVGQYWLRPDIGLRLSLAYDDEQEGSEEPPFFTDSSMVTRYTTTNTTSWRLGAGITIQKRKEAFVEREKHFAPLLGLALLAGREDRGVRQQDQAYERDSTGVGAAVPGTDILQEQQDRLFFAGLEVAPGLSGPLGRRWEVDLRLPVEITWWSLLDRTVTNYPAVPTWWDEPVNFGVRLPRVYVHYRW